MARLTVVATPTNWTVRLDKNCDETPDWVSQGLPYAGNAISKPRMEFYRRRRRAERPEWQGGSLRLWITLPGPDAWNLGWCAPIERHSGGVNGPCPRRHRRYSGSTPDAHRRHRSIRCASGAPPLYLRVHTGSLTGPALDLTACGGWRLTEQAVPRHRLNLRMALKLMAAIRSGKSLNSVKAEVVAKPKQLMQAGRVNDLNWPLLENSRCTACGKSHH